MERTTTQSATGATREHAFSRRHLLTLAGLGALVPGAALLTRVMGRFTPTPTALPTEATPPLDVILALPPLPGASPVGRRAFVRTNGGVEAPAAYAYFHLSNEVSWQSIISFYERALPSLGWAVRRNQGKQGGLGFSRGGYSGFLARTTVSNKNQPASYYLFLGALS